jgi:hypothetical protein
VQHRAALVETPSLSHCMKQKMKSVCRKSCVRDLNNWKYGQSIWCLDLMSPKCFRLDGGILSQLQSKFLASTDHICLVRPPTNLLQYTKGVTMTSPIRWCLNQALLALPPAESDSIRLSPITFSISMDITAFEHSCKAPLQSVVFCHGRNYLSRHETWTILLLHLQGSGSCLINRDCEDRAASNQVGLTLHLLILHLHQTLQRATWVNTGVQHVPRDKCGADSMRSLFRNQALVSGLLLKRSETNVSYPSLSHLPLQHQSASIALCGWKFNVVTGHRSKLPPDGSRFCCPRRTRACGILTLPTLTQDDAWFFCVLKKTNHSISLKAVPHEVRHSTCKTPQYKRRWMCKMYLDKQQAHVLNFCTSAHRLYVSSFSPSPRSCNGQKEAGV